MTKSITQNFLNDKDISSVITRFSHIYSVGSILKSCNAYKSKGYSVISLFLYLLGLIFTNRSMYMNFLTGKHKEAFGKDTVYRFLNSTSIHWSKVTSMLAANVANKTIVPLTHEDRKNVFIIDDTLFERSSSKKMELLSKVYDHVSHTYKRGFRLLTLGWSDGNTFLPVNSALLASEKSSNLYQGMQDKIDKRTIGYKRRKLAQTKAPKVMMDLLDQALQAGLRASYVLFDTWFCSPTTLIQIKEKNLDVIAMVKKTPKIHYIYNGVKQSVTQIYSSTKKRRGKSKYLLSVEIIVEKDGQQIPARLVCVRNRNKKKDWLALICTDTTITEEEIIRVYGKRWNIEVFFKVCKSYLKLAKENRSLSYDAATAHVAVVFSRYILLAVENRKENDQRSFGELFYSIIDEMADITLQEAMLILMEIFLATIEDKLSLTEKQLNELLDTFILNLPPTLQRGLKSCI